MGDKNLKYPFIDGWNNFPQDENDDIAEIRKWLQTQLHLPYLNDEFLHLFLHSNYHNIEETKKNIESYFTLRSTSPELFCNRSISNPKIQTAMEYCLFGASPVKTKEGYQVIFVSLSDKSASDYVQVDTSKVMFTFFDVMISEYGLCPGYVMVFDSRAFSLSHFLRINYNAIKKIVKYFQEAAPVRVKSLQVINSVSFMDKLFALCRPFMYSRLLDIIQFHGSDLTNFYKTVPREAVFEEFGGTCGSLKDANENYLRLLRTKYSKWIEEESIYAVDQSKKVEPPKKSFFSFW